ncbi:hypothetical protein NDU88_004778 [Pleurodeles waltl]|uniref:Secreted protein n=1 Tax=Pleurodeles waltl TaxID=8319 RepID=A0AAV7T927_PLEWA|nr:hypothetical protein NDU88_004778 [Pleurodeles waltl]
MAPPLFVLFMPWPHLRTSPALTWAPAAHACALSDPPLNRALLLILAAAARSPLSGALHPYVSSRPPANRRGARSHLSTLTDRPLPLLGGTCGLSRPCLRTPPGTVSGPWHSTWRHPASQTLGPRERQRAPSRRLISVKGIRSGRYHRPAAELREDAPRQQPS